jgi:ribonuclease HI
VVSGVESVYTWQANNWFTKCCGPVKNLELWKRFVELVADKHEFKAIWVKGHSNSMYNERCDKLAKAARDKLINKAKREGKYAR